MAMESAKRVMSGTHGEIWLDGEQVAECYKFQAKVTLNKEDVPQCGVMWTDSKVKNMTGKGSVGLYKVSSRMARLIGEQARAGKDPRFTIISKLDDPDAYGAERVAVKNVSFDDLTLAISSAWTNITEAAIQIEIAQANLDVAGENLSLNTFSYNEGQLAVLDVISSQISWIQAYTNVITAHFNEKVAISAYRKAANIRP